MQSKTIGSDELLCFGYGISQTRLNEIKKQGTGRLKPESDCAAVLACVDKAAFPQKGGGLGGRFAVEQHGGVRSGQYDVVFHARTIGFFDGNRAVVPAPYAQQSAHAYGFAARQTAQFDTGRQGGGEAVQSGAIRFAQREARQPQPLQPGGGKAALVRRAQSNDSAADVFGVSCGKMAQYQTAQAVADKVQRFVAVQIMGFNLCGQRGGVCGNGVFEAAVAERTGNKTLLPHHAGEGLHHPRVHIQAVQQQNTGVHGGSLSCEKLIAYAYYIAVKFFLFRVLIQRPACIENSNGRLRCGGLSLLLLSHLLLV